MPTQQEEEGVNAINAVLQQLSQADKFRVLARINDSANQNAVQYERDEFALRRERILEGRRRDAARARVEGKDLP